MVVSFEKVLCQLNTDYLPPPPPPPPHTTLNEDYLPPPPLPYTISPTPTTHHLPSTNYVQVRLPCSKCTGECETQRKGECGCRTDAICITKKYKKTKN
ncbi:UNVERIFIED_CONTAM: hypothetical protein RMT77_019915 [Armadillidium vulgare]